MARFSELWNEALHPRDRLGRFRSKWKLSGPAKVQVDSILDGFRPRTLPDYQQANHYGVQRGWKHYTGPQKRAITQYVKRDFRAIDAELEQGKTSPESDLIDSAMKPLPDDLLVTWSGSPEDFGLGPNDVDAMEELTGKLISRETYTPTWLAGGTNNGGVVAHIVAPKGTPAIFPGGAEVTIARGQPFRVTRTDKDPATGRRRLFLVAVPPGTGEKVETDLPGAIRAGREADNVEARQQAARFPNRPAGEQPAIESIPEPLPVKAQEIPERLPTPNPQAGEIQPPTAAPTPTGDTPGGVEADGRPSWTSGNDPIEIQAPGGGAGLRVVAGNRVLVADSPDMEALAANADRAGLPEVANWAKAGQRRIKTSDAPASGQRAAKRAAAARDLKANEETNVPETVAPKPAAETAPSSVEAPVAPGPTPSAPAPAGEVAPEATPALPVAAPQGAPATPGAQLAPAGQPEALQSPIAQAVAPTPPGEGVPEASSTTAPEAPRIAPAPLPQSVTPAPVPATPEAPTPAPAVPEAPQVDITQPVPADATPEYRAAHFRALQEAARVAAEQRAPTATPTPAKKAVKRAARKATPSAVAPEAPTEKAATPEEIDITKPVPANASPEFRAAHFKALQRAARERRGRRDETNAAATEAPVKKAVKAVPSKKAAKATAPELRERAESAGIDVPESATSKQEVLDAIVTGLLERQGGAPSATTAKKTARKVAPEKATTPTPEAKPAKAAARKVAPEPRGTLEAREAGVVSQREQDRIDDALNAEQRKRWSDALGSEPKNMAAGDVLLDEMADLLRNGRTTRPKAAARLRDAARDDQTPEADYLRKVADFIEADTSKPAKRVPVKRTPRPAPDVERAEASLAGRTDRNIQTGMNALPVGDLRALADKWGVETRGEDKKLKLKSVLSKELSAKWKATPDLQRKSEGAPETPAPTKAVKTEGAPEVSALAKAVKTATPPVAAPIPAAGTAKGKITAGRLTPGTKILVSQNEDGTWRPATQKTGATVLAVSGVDAVTGGRTTRRLIRGTDPDGREITVNVSGTRETGRSGVPAHQTFILASPSTGTAAPAPTKKAVAPEVTATKALRAPAKKATPETPMTDRERRAERRRSEAPVRTGVPQTESTEAVPARTREQEKFDESASNLREQWQEAIGRPPASMSDLNETGLHLIAGNVANKKLSQPAAARRLRSIAEKQGDTAFGDYLRKLADHLESKPATKAPAGAVPARASATDSTETIVARLQSFGDEDEARAYLSGLPVRKLREVGEITGGGAGITKKADLIDAIAYSGVGYRIESEILRRGTRPRVAPKKMTASEIPAASPDSLVRGVDEGSVSRARAIQEMQTRNAQSPSASNLETLKELRQAPASKRVLAKKATPGPAELAGATSHKEADDMLEGLDRDQLLDVARQHGVQVPAGSTKSKLRQQIVQWTVGRRLDSMALANLSPEDRESSRLRAMRQAEARAAEMAPSVSPSKAVKTTALTRATKKAVGPATPTPSSEPLPTAPARTVTPAIKKTAPNLEVVKSRRDLTTEQIVRGEHLTEAGRAALDSLGAAGHPGIAKIADTRGKIREAYNMLAMPGNDKDNYVALADLRKLIGDQATRAEVDAELLKMSRDNTVDLVPQSYARGNAATRIPAAVTIGGQERNLIRFKEPSKPSVESPSPSRVARGRYTRAQLTGMNLGELKDVEDELGVKRTSVNKQDRVDAILRAINEEGESRPKAEGSQQTTPSTPTAGRGSATTPGLAVKDASNSITRNSSRIVRRDRPRADEPIHLPNGGSNQGLIHLDSELGKLWADLYMDDREPNSFVNEIARMGDNMGRGKLGLKDFIARLKEMKKRASDKAIADRIQEAIDAVDAPPVKLDLPSGLPAALRKAFEDLADIPTARKRGLAVPVSRNGERAPYVPDVRIGNARLKPGDPSVLEKKLEILRRIVAGKDELSLSPYDTASELSKRDFHESADAATAMWKIFELAVNDPEVKKWLREQALKARAKQGNS